MKVKHIFIFVLFVAILSSFLHPSKSFADWAYSFVVYNGYTYVISDEFVTEIDKEIGQVTKYSDKKGTKYYSVKGVSTDTAIAVEDYGKYKKAIRKVKYAGGIPIVISPIYLIVLFVLSLGVTFIVKKCKKFILIL